MKLLLVASLLLAPLALAAPRHRGQPVDDTPLAHHMESIEEAVKRLRRTLRDETQGVLSLELVANLQRETLAAKALVPAMAESVPEAERPAFVTAYRRAMVDFLARQLELEAALLDGDAAAVDAAFTRVRDMEESGHERFTEDEG